MENTSVVTSNDDFVINSMNSLSSKLHKSIDECKTYSSHSISNIPLVSRMNATVNKFYESQITFMNKIDKNASAIIDLSNNYKAQDADLANHAGELLNGR